MRKWFLCNLLTVVVAVLQGQNTPVQMLPPPPTAYSLGKYGDIPVSLYTGVPDIGVPVASIRNKDAAVDISLSYHGSGIKVDEVASFTGLGWSLNAGGVITRVVRGRPETLLADGSHFPKRTNIQFYDYEKHPAKDDFIQQNNLYQASSGGTDNEPDLFYYNFQGRSGKFVFDTNGKPLTESKEPLDIKWLYVDRELQKFVVTDEKGFVFEFSDREETFYPEEGVNRTAAWYLSRITSPAGNTIRFEYFPASSSNQLTRSYETAFIDVLPYNTSVTPPLKVPFQGTGYSEIRLHNISSESGRIEFVYKGERRKDYAPLPITNAASAALDEVRVYRPDGGLLKKVKLYTSYFEANDREKYDGLDPALFSYLNYRLRLDSVQEYSSNDSSRLPPYTFVYAGDNNPLTDDPFTLPYRLSPSQDHWGYYNQSYNTHLIPGLAKPESIYIPAWYKQFCPPDGPESIFTAISGGANREPDSVAVLAGMLSELHYPTGGHTVFRFEGSSKNTNMPGVRIGKIISYPVAGVPVETNYSYRGYAAFRRSDYFEAYLVSYFYGEVNPRVSTLQQFGVPVDGAYGVLLKKYIKVTVHPQAILGGGAQAGYTDVTVSQPGKGSVTSVYSSQERFHDYDDREFLDEYTPAEVRLLDKLFVSEYIDDMDSPWGGPSGNVNTRTLGSREWPYPEGYSNAWKRGLLTDRYTRSESSKMLKSEHFDYYHKLIQVIPGFKVIRLPNSTHQYVYSAYYVPHTWSKLRSVETIDYDQDGAAALTSTTAYMYDTVTHMQPLRVETSRSDGRTEVADITYPSDYHSGTPFIDDMVSKHLLAYPVEQVRYITDGTSANITGGSISMYKEGGLGLKAQELQLQVSAPVRYADFNFSNRPAHWMPSSGYAQFLPDKTYQVQLRLDEYDGKGNLLQATPDRNFSTTYIWGYQQLYPIAEVQNATREECFYSGFEDEGTAGDAHTGMRSHTGDYAVNWEKPNLKKYEVSYWYKLSGVWMFSGVKTYEKPFTIHADAVDDIRICPDDAHMVTYTFAPLTGMTSQTDERNRTTYYEYDVFGRLHLVRDHELNIIRKICYGYTGQVQGCSVSGKVFWNQAVSDVFKSSVCPPGYVSRPVYYAVAEHTYSSEISQADADAQAEKDLAVNGPLTANSAGLCSKRVSCLVCVGADKKCIAGSCETGTRVSAGSKQTGASTYECAYYYQWSDGTTSKTYVETSDKPCVIRPK